MMARTLKTTLLLALTIAFSFSLRGSGQDAPSIYPGASEKTPARSHYFDWINSQYEGTTEAHTLVNLEFFKWLHDDYGMRLDVYSLDVGNIDDGPYTAGVGRLIPSHYGTTDSREFKRQFPRGFGPLADKAASFDCRLGIWLGPDGYGKTESERKKRHDMLVSLCRDENFLLFKIDGVAGKLPVEKQKYLIETLIECRKHCPDLIVLNERIDFGKASPYITTELWKGAETYIDVFMSNETTAPHHRAGTLGRPLTPGMNRLMEDHGVCLSSCLDHWDDELVLQAFNRSLVVSPQIYGNPWFLRDDEYPKLARLFNLSRRFGDLLTSAMQLPEKDYGPFAVSRGNESTRVVTLRNLNWEPETFEIELDESIGLSPENEQINLRQFHPTERMIGTYEKGQKVAIEVLPFRTCLLVASAEPLNEIGVHGTEYDVVRDVADKPVWVDVRGEPGTEATITLDSSDEGFASATLNGRPLDGFVDGNEVTIEFPGKKRKLPWHREIGSLTESDVPTDAEALFESTCFAADSNALEVRSLRRSGESRIPQVQQARKSFLDQPMFINRSIWDRQLFDGNLNTFFAARLEDRVLRIDLGELVRMDELVIRIRDRQSAWDDASALRFDEDAVVEVSSDLLGWTKLDNSWKGVGTIAEIPISNDQPIRYIRVSGAPHKIAEVEGYFQGRLLNREKWRASNLLGSYRTSPAQAAWQLKFQLEEIAPDSKLVVALNGKHGSEGAYAALRVGDRYIGAPDRAVSYPSNTWEYKNVEAESNYCYYFPMDESLVGETIEIVVLSLKDHPTDFKAQAWITSSQIPHAKKRLVLYRKK